MRTRSPVLLVFLACTPTSGGDTGDTGSDTTAAPTTTTSAAGTTTGDDPTTTAPDPTTADVTSDPTDATTLATTTGGLEYCQGWAGPDGPRFLDLHDKAGNLLEPGSPLPLECGGQGLFMFGLYPTFGGFTPPGDILDLQLVVDVDGFNDNPEGHFYSADPVGYYIACDGGVGGIDGVVPIFPLDNLDDLTALDGEPAQIHLVMPTGDDPIVVDLDVVLSVTKDDSWGFCGG